MNPHLLQLTNRLAPTLNNLTKTPLADASVLLAITNEALPKLLLTRRASHMNAHAGEVSFPGGKYEMEDKSNVGTALRETYEETRLHPDSVKIIGQLEPQQSKAGLSVRPIVAMIPPTPALIADKREIARIFWAELDWLITEPTQQYLVDTELNGLAVKLQTPSWCVDGEVVWGLTGRIIANLLTVAFNREVDWYYNIVT